MIGTCPNCGIKLKEPPFGNRETNEVMITLRFRKMIDNNSKPKPIEETGICEICEASLEAIKKQRLFLNNNFSFFQFSSS
ncbi:MAG: hypothetical protein AABW90_00140 [Nanoarchaeota archaeon]